MATATLMTSAEFLARPDEFDQSGNRIKEELIAGEIVKMAEPSKWHDLLKNEIGFALASHRELGVRALIEIAFVVTPHNTFTPDVAVVRTERFAEEGRLLTRAPEIAIEIVSPTDTVKDIRAKVKTYLANGAGAVWIFYDDGAVAVHTASGTREINGEEHLEDPLLPGFSVPVSALYFVP
jgi:Uma2 family endonuclease